MDDLDFCTEYIKQLHAARRQIMQLQAEVVRFKDGRDALRQIIRRYDWHTRILVATTQAFINHHQSPTSFGLPDLCSASDAWVSANEYNVRIFEKLNESERKLPDCPRQAALRGNVRNLPGTPTAPQVITALLEALERADILLDQTRQTIDVVAVRTKMDEAKRMAEDWENRE